MYEFFADPAFFFSELARYKYAVTFWGSFFFGETVILSALFLALEQSWSLSLVLLAAFCGTIASDFLWFLFGRHLLLRTAYWQKLEKKHARFLTKFRHIGERRELFYLLFFKFLYGTRVITILYVSINRMSAGKFLLYNALGTLIWLAALFLVSWATWSGFTRALDAFHDIRYIALVIIIVIIIVKLTTRWLSQTYLERS